MVDKDFDWSKGMKPSLGPEEWARFYERYKQSGYYGKTIFEILTKDVGNN